MQLKIQIKYEGSVWLWPHYTIDVLEKIYSVRLKLRVTFGLL
jgi:hypothetical protein